MATFTAYWSDSMWRGAVEAGLDGQPIPALWSGTGREPRFNRFGRRDVGAGDRVVVITCRAGVLYALCSLDVTERIRSQPRDPMSRYRFRGCGDGGVRGVPRAVLSAARPLTSQETFDWRFEPGDGARLLRYGEGGRVQASSAVGVRQVSEQTAAMLEGVLQRRSAVDPTGAAPLEARLVEHPDDEALARVLADAWQAQDDPRGELLSLELALRHERDLDAAAALDARLAELAGRNRRQKKQSGGFPFRPAWGVRPAAALDAWLPLGRMRPDRALAFARQFVATEGFHDVELRGNQSTFALDLRLHDLGAVDWSSWDSPDTHWTRWNESFTPGDVEQMIEKAPLRYAFYVVASGPLVFPGTQRALPLQGEPLWTGWRGRSKVTFSFGRSVPTSATLELCVPLGSALAEDALSRWIDSLQRFEARVRRRDFHSRQLVAPPEERDPRLRRHRAPIEDWPASRWPAERRRWVESPEI